MPRSAPRLSVARPTLTPLAIIALVGGGCGDDPGDGAGETMVPLDAPALAPLGTDCLALGEDEDVLGTSPEGDLWLAAPGTEDGTTGLRVVGTDAAAGPAFEIPYGPVEAGQPWGPDRATVIAGGRLVTVDDGLAFTVPFPEDAGTPRGFCGDPADDGDAFVLADGVYERTAGQWWRWRPGGAGGFGDVSWIARVDGACRAPDGALWVGVDGDGPDDGGAAWRLDDEEVARVDGLGPARGVAYAGRGIADPDAPPADADPNGVTLLAGGDLFAATAGWDVVRFEAGAVDAVSATVGTLWARVGDRAFAREADRETWGRLPQDDVLSVHPHAAGGAWIVRPRQVCHVTTAPRFEVRGLRPREQRLARTATLEVTVADGSGPLRVLRDGVEVADVPAVDGRFTVADLDLGDRGAHALLLEDVGTGRSRALPYVLRAGDGGTWTEDIEPLFQTSCAAGPCHGPDPNDADRPDLSTYEAWVEWSETIAVRVGVLGDMPPSEVRAESWGPDQIETIVAWIEGGMERGE